MQSTLADVITKFNTEKAIMHQEHKNNINKMIQNN